MSRRLRRLAAGAMLGAAFTARASAQPSAPSALRAIASSLPITEVAADSGSALALFLSGDGGWAGGDRAVAQALARSGIAVVGLDMRKYLRAAHRTPESTARDAAEILERYATAWRRNRLVLVGYSRGANLAPFVVSRLPEATRRRLALVALIGLGDRASFEFHWEDLLHDVPRKTDLPTRPELERIRGTQMLCLYGQGENGSVCPSLDPALARVARHAGGHVLDTSSGAAAAALVVNALR